MIREPNEFRVNSLGTLLVDSIATSWEGGRWFQSTISCSETSRFRCLRARRSLCRLEKRYRVDSRRIRRDRTSRSRYRPISVPFSSGFEPLPLSLCDRCFLCAIARPATLSAHRTTRIDVPNATSASNARIYEDIEFRTQSIGECTERYSKIWICYCFTFFFHCINLAMSYILENRHTDL